MRLLPLLYLACALSVPSLSFAVCSNLYEQPTGGTGDDQPASNNYYQKISLTAAGSLTRVEIYVFGTSGTMSGEAAIYMDNFGIPGFQQQVSNLVTIGNGWNSLDFASPYALNGTTPVWIGVHLYDTSATLGAIFEPSLELYSGANGPFPMDGSSLSYSGALALQMRLQFCDFSTPTPTASPTPTITASFSASPSATPTYTLSGTSTPSSSPTASSTPTITASPSATPTYTLSGTSTPSSSPTASPTPTITASFTPSATATPSATMSPSFSESPTRTISATFTPVSTSTPALNDYCNRAPWDPMCRECMLFPEACMRQEAVEGPPAVKRFIADNGGPPAHLAYFGSNGTAKANQLPPGGEFKIFRDVNQFDHPKWVELYQGDTKLDLVQVNWGEAIYRLPANMPPGIYYLVVTDGRHRSYRLNFIVQ